MTQNLRLENKTLTINDSDINSNSYTLPLSNKQSGWCSSSSCNYSDKSMLYNDPDKEDIYGVYYNWTAATAGVGKNCQQGDVLYSICPKGWKLPSKIEADNFIEIYNGQPLKQPPLSFYANGYIGGGGGNAFGPNDNGSGHTPTALLWTSTGIGGTCSYSSPTDVYTIAAKINTNELTYQNGRVSYGQGIRCLFSE